MAITIGSATTIYTGLNMPQMSALGVTDDIIGAFFQDIGESPEQRAYILFNRQTLTAGTKTVVDTAGVSSVVYALRATDNLGLVLYAKDSDDDGYGKTITNSGLVPAQQAEAEFFDGGAPEMVFNGGGAAARHTSLSVGLMAYRNLEAANQTVFTKFTVAGNVSFSSNTNATNSPTTVPLAMAHWTGNKYAYCSYVGAMNLRILDTTTGITEHSVQSEGTHSDVNWAEICRIDDTRMLCFWFDNTTRDYFAAVGTLSGTATITYGSLLTVHSGTTANLSGSTILKRDNNKFVIGYRTAGSTWKFETVTVSGTTVTQDGDAGTLSASLGKAHILGFTGDDAAVVYLDGSTAIKYRPLSNLPNLSSGLARFYHGLGSLAEKFTLPFAGVQPGAMTLDKSLGTVVMGQNAASTVPVVYSLYPYVTGVATATGMPTGTSISSLKWV